MSMHGKALEVLNKINNAGFISYIVGGYPRDLYLGRSTSDIDICTSATPKDLKNIFGKAMLPKVNYGSVTVIYKKVRFEITTFRKEYKYENNRIPIKIEYIDNLMDDLKRRDFTINTLCIDAASNTIDLLDGAKDIDRRLIKMVGSPKDKLKEDALRILRAVRFATQLNFAIDPELKKYIKKYANLVKKLSYHRKKEELDKIFLSQNVEYGIRLIKELKLDKPLEINVDSLVLNTYPIGIWYQLKVPSGYEFNSNDYDVIKKLNELEKLDIRNNFTLYKYGLYVISIMADIKNIDKKEITSLYNNLPIKAISDIKLQAKDIMNILNKEAGPYLKNIIYDLENSILSGTLENDKDILTKYVLDKYSNI